MSTICKYYMYTEPTVFESYPSGVEDSICSRAFPASYKVISVESCHEVTMV